MDSVIQSGATQQPAAIDDRLRALAGNERIDLLTELFARMGSLKDGVDAERFRIDFKNRRADIDKLRSWFIKETYEPKRTYRPSLIALPLIDNTRSSALLVLIDRVLVYLASAYEADPGCQISLAQLSDALAVPAEQVGEALDYVIESPASASRTTGYPEGPEWYIMPGEQSLDYPDLKAALQRMTEWAERAANAPQFVLQDGVPVIERPQRTETPRSWLVSHWKVLSASIGGVVAFLASLIAVIQFLFG